MQTSIKQLSNYYWVHIAAAAGSFRREETYQFDTDPQNIHDLIFKSKIWKKKTIFH